MLPIFFFSKGGLKKELHLGVEIPRCNSHSMSSSYEKHAEMLIHCGSMAVYAYFVSMFALSFMATLAFIAFMLTPVDVFTLLFDIVIVCMAVQVFKIAANLLEALFFSDCVKEKIKQPLFTILSNGSASKTTVFKLDRESAAKTTSAPESSVHKTSAVGECVHKTSAVGECVIKKCPGTPDSERSQACTEVKGTVDEIQNIE